MVSWKLSYCWACTSQKLWWIITHHHQITCRKSKVRLSLSKKVCDIIIYLIESHLKIMKNVFCFILKAFSFLKIFKFSSRIFDHAGKTVWLWRHNLVYKKLQYTYISQSKGNQTMKFGQLIEYNKKHIFFKNYAENEARRLVPYLFLSFKKA